MAKKAQVAGVAWDRITLAPVVLVRGKEELLAERAMQRLRNLARAADPQVEITRLHADDYQPRQLATYTSPSLFGEPRLVEISGVEKRNDHLLNDLLNYVAQPEPDVWLVVRHAGGAAGKKLLQALASVPTVACNEISTPAEKMSFLQAEVKRARRRISTQAARVLLDAVGSDVRSLAAAIDQLLCDTTGVITDEAVATYYGGRIEAKSFAVADAAVAGDPATALTLTRHALATGASPHLLLSALAYRLRELVRASNPHTSMPAWQRKRAQQILRAWSENSLARAITAVAAADEEIKGASRDAQFALERAVRLVATAPGIK